MLLLDASIAPEALAGTSIMVGSLATVPDMPGT